MDFDHLRSTACLVSSIEVRQGGMELGRGFFTKVVNRGRKTNRASRYQRQTTKEKNSFPLDICAQRQEKNQTTIVASIGL